MPRLALGMALCLWASPSGADDGPRLHIALTAYMAASGADLSTTMYCIGARTCHEANRVMRVFIDQPAALGAIKMGTAALSSWALLKAHKAHPKLTFWVATGGAGWFTAVALHNARVGQRRG